MGNGAFMDCVEEKPKMSKLGRGMEKNGKYGRILIMPLVR